MSIIILQGHSIILPILGIYNFGDFLGDVGPCILQFFIETFLFLFISTVFRCTVLYDCDLLTFNLSLTHILSVTSSHSIRLSLNVFVKWQQLFRVLVNSITRVNILSTHAWSVLHFRFYQYRLYKMFIISLVTSFLACLQTMCWTRHLFITGA